MSNIAELLTRNKIPGNQRLFLLELKDQVTEEKRLRGDLSAIADAITMTCVALDGVPLSGHCMADTVSPEARDMRQRADELRLRIQSQIETAVTDYSMGDLQIIKRLKREYDVPDPR